LGDKSYREEEKITGVMVSGQNTVLGLKEDDDEACFLCEYNIHLIFK